MEIKNENMTNESLTGLCIHVYKTKEMSLPEKERPFLLFLGLITCLQKFEKEIQKFLDKNTKDSLFQYSSQFLSIIKNTLKFIIKTKDDTKYRFEPELKEFLKGDLSSYYTIKNFNFYGRGLLISLIHTLENELAKYQRRVQSHGSFSFSLNSKDVLIKSCEKSLRKLKVLETLASVFSIAAEKLKDYKGLSYFNDDVDITKFEEITKLDVSDFMHEIGTQFVPSLSLFFGLLVQGTASHSESFGSSWGNTSFIWNNIYYFFNSEEAATKTNHFFKNVDVEKGQSFWNFHDKDYVKAGLYFTLDNVDTSVTFQIKKETILKLKDEEEDLIGSSEYYSKDKIKMELKDDQKEEKKVDKKFELDFERQGEKLNFEQFEKSYTILLEEIKSNPLSSIQIRLISPFKLNVSEEIKMESDFPTLEAVKKLWDKIYPPKEFNDSSKKGNIIFHIHGGGFVAMSTFAHESYLRKWSILTGLPIISVDYKLAPKYKFPTPVDEVFTAYKWVLQNAPKISGDSAGGNLSLGLTERCIYEKIRVPDGLAISYPASYLSESPSPARLNSLIDPLVNFTFLKMCGDSYLNKEIGHNGLNNPFISPLLMPDEILKQFPPTYVSVGTLDPLFDDTIVLVKRLDELECQVKLDVYDGLAHGYLNLLDFVNEAKIANSRLCGWINNFVQKK